MRAAKASADVAQQELEALALHVDPAQLFVAVYAHVAIAPADEISEGTHGHVPALLELLAYYMYPFFGKAGSKKLSAHHVNEAVDALHQAFNASWIWPIDTLSQEGRDRARSLAQSVRMYTEVVRGSAYPDQTQDEIRSVQGAFERWFASRLGIGPDRAVAVLESIFSAQQAAVDPVMREVTEQATRIQALWRKAKAKVLNVRKDDDLALLRAFPNENSAGAWGFSSQLTEIALERLPVAREDLVGLSPPPTPEEWAAFLTMLGMTPEARSSMAAPVDVRDRPLYVLPDGRVLVSDVSHASDVLWERFEQAARGDAKFYDRYQKKRASWLEARLLECLRRVFPTDHVYAGLSYPDPDKEAGATTELDGAVVWGPFLVLAEAKAKQFRQESQRGDIGRLRSDLKANVGDAFEQASRALRYLRSVRSAEFFETRTGRKLSVRMSRIRRLYLLTVSQHELAGLATRPAELRDLGLFAGGEYPVSMSIADLDVVTRFCEGPDVFLHYLERRTELQKIDIWLQADELDLFGAYLSSRLRMEQFPTRRGEEPVTHWLTGFSERFDRELIPGYGGGGTSSIGLKLPPEIHAVLRELRTRDDDSARWIAFALLDMSDTALGAIATAVRDLAIAQIAPNKFRRMVHQEGDTVVVVLGSRGLPLFALEERTRARTHMEKYRRKASKAIGLGLALDQGSSPFHVAVWIEGQWAYDQAIETMLKYAPPESISPGHQPPGRNDKCICGSGKKFKNCCANKLR